MTQNQTVGSPQNKVKRKSRKRAKVRINKVSEFVRDLMISPMERTPTSGWRHAPAQPNPW
jgi:hypothetical protein